MKYNRSQLMTAIQHWTKKLNEDDSNSQTNQIDDQERNKINQMTGLQAFQHAITDSRDIENLINIKDFTVRLRFNEFIGYTTPMQSIDCIMEHMKIVKYYSNNGICICEKYDDKRNASGELRMQLAFASKSPNSEFVFLFEHDYDSSYCVPGVLKDCKNGILQLEYDFKIRIPQEVTIGETKFSTNFRERYKFNSCDLNKSLIDEAIFLDNTYHVVRHGAMYTCNNVKRIKIENGIKTIASEAISHCDQLEEILLPDSLESIGSAAFTYLPKLTSIIIPDSVVRIDGNAFGSWNGSILNTVKMPKNLLQLGAGIFSYTPITDITIFINSTTTRFGLYEIYTYQFKNITIDAGLCQKDFIYYTGEGQYVGYLHICGQCVETIRFISDKVLDIINTTPDHKHKLMIDRCQKLKTIYVPSERFKDYVYSHCQRTIDEQNVQVIIEQ